MSTVYVFPLRNDLPQYSFTITLDGSIFTIQMLFNVRMNRWIMNINDSSGNQILSGIPVLIQRDFTSQYTTLSVPLGEFVCTDDTGQQNQPTQFSFGIDHTCFYIDPN